jgi:hypothetical protein
MSQTFQPSEHSAYSGLWDDLTSALGINEQTGAVGGTCVDQAGDLGVKGAKVSCAALYDAQQGNQPGTTSAYVADEGMVSDYDVTEEISETLQSLIPEEAPDWMKTDKRVALEAEEERLEKQKKMLIAGATGVGGLILVAVLVRISRGGQDPAPAPKA